MKAFRTPPTDPRMKEMNEAQWLWSYFNIQEDEKEDEESWKNRLDYLTWFINPEMAKSVHEQEARAKKKDSRPIGSNEFRADEAVFQSDEFEIEAKAATLGYNPESGLTPREFLIQKQSEMKKEKEVDIINDDFETLLASGEFTEVIDTSKGAGDPFETFDDFISRVQHNESLSQEEWEMIEQMQFAQENIGIESLEDVEAIDYENESTDQYDKEKLLAELERQGLTEDDLDIFEVDEDE